MTDVWAMVADLDEATQQRMADVLELRGADPKQRALRAECLAGADARALPFADASFDVVVFDSTLSHVPEPERALVEAARVLRPGGWLAAFDGDYATTTVALGDHDPLQICVEAMMANSLTDRRVMRRLPSLVRGCGLELSRDRSHGHVEAGNGGYMLTIIERGADMLAAAGTIGDELAVALKHEARRRSDAGTFFGHIAYMSVIACKPG